MNAYTNIAGGRVVVSARVPSTGAAGDGRAIASDDFASSTWSGGDGFEGAWTHSGDAVVSSGAACLRQSTGDIRRAVDVGGQSGLSLSFQARVQGFEAGDTASVKVSADGGAFQTVTTFGAGDSDDTYHAVHVDLGAFAGASTLVIRFDAQMSSASDTLFVDDVTVR